MSAVVPLIRAPKDLLSQLDRNSVLLGRPVNYLVDGRSRSHNLPPIVYELRLNLATRTDSESVQRAALAVGFQVFPQILISTVSPPG